MGAHRAGGSATRWAHHVDSVGRRFSCRCCSGGNNFSPTPAIPMTSLRLSLLALLTATACSKAPADRPAADTSAAPARSFVAGAHVPKDALTSMRWILGSFRGTGAEEYELRGDSLTDAGATHYAATAISPDSVTFSPRAGANNSFTWRMHAACSCLDVRRRGPRELRATADRRVDSHRAHHRAGSRLTHLPTLSSSRASPGRA